MKKKLALVACAGTVALGMVGVAIGEGIVKPANVLATDYTFTMSGFNLWVNNDAVSPNVVYYGTSTITSNKMTVASDSASALAFTLVFANDFSFTIANGSSYLVGATASTTFKFDTSTFSWAMASVTAKNCTFSGITPVGSNAAYAIALDSSKTSPLMISKAGSGNNFGAGKTYKIGSLYTAALFSAWILTDSNFSSLLCAEKAYRAKCLHQLVNVDAFSITSDAAARYTAWCAAAGITE